MTIYAVTYRYSDDVATRDRVRPEHREYLRGLADRGQLLLSGPFGPGEPAGGLLILRAEGKAEVGALIAKDPFTTSSVIVSSEIAEWDPVIGPLSSGIS
ncbi:YciI family protein [Pseudonocardia sp. DLS-67]